MRLKRVKKWRKPMNTAFILSLLSECSQRCGKCYRMIDYPKMRKKLTLEWDGSREGELKN
jgi:hypothetical protein